MVDDSDVTLTQPSNSQIDWLLKRETELENLRHSLRVGQRDIADWEGGELAISAVPGAGKSTGMAVGAAIAIARYQLHAKHRLVVVTFTRSAAASIKAKISTCLRQLALPPNSFAVNTLHGLALNIATRHPELSGINLDSATVITPNQTHRLIKACVEQWIANHPRRYFTLLEGQNFDGEETERLRRQSVLRTEVLPAVANIVIHEAKSSGMKPEDLWDLSQQTTDPYEILGIAAGLYEQYQIYARSRDFIDYDDMILAALRVLENKSARQLWQNQVFAVFEDEAQDSTPLQSKLLEILATNANEAVNLVRVGDPNQAINSTFTPADPKYFLDFCKRCNSQGKLATMDRAGRSSRAIIDTANYTLDWVNRQYGGKTNNPLFWRQNIRPVDPGDPQADANPEETGRGVEIYTPSDVYETVELIEKRIIELFKENPEGNAAILVRENRQGSFLAEKLSHLRARPDRIEVYDVAQSDRHSYIPSEILKLLQFIDRPHSPDYLKATLEVLVKRQLIPTQDLNAIATFPEQFLYPGPLDPPQTAAVSQACRYCRALLRARQELPHYQLISFLALTLKYDQSDLATADKLSERVGRQMDNASLGAMLDALNEIVSSERFEAVDTDNEQRYTRTGQVTIITMHKAKGLDWDYVFLPFLHEDTLPGSLRVPAAAQFLGDYTLADVARAQIRASLHQEYPLPEAAIAWEQAGLLKTAEEFRLLYVAMTRAKRLLWMSAEEKGPFRWNIFNGKESDNLQVKKPCPLIPALIAHFPDYVISSSTPVEIIDW